MPTPAEMRDRYRAIAYRYRNLPAQHGLRPYTVSVVTKSYTGDVTGEGNQVEIVTPITESDGQPPKVRWLNDEELALGQLGKGTIEVGPITPDFSGGGTDIATLLQTSAENAELVLYRVTGPEFPNGADFKRVGSDSSAALHYKIRLQPVASQ